MFGPAGYLHVYRSYGIHWCMNVVTHEAGSASAVLLRAALVHDHSVSEGADNVPLVLYRGPGNLTRVLGITGVDNGEDCCERGGRVEFLGSVENVHRQVGRSTRVGISRERDRQWRFFLEES